MFLAQVINKCVKLIISKCNWNICLTIYIKLQKSVLWWMCYKSKFNLHTYYLPNADSFITFKLSYCGILPINCPSQEDFEYFDNDKNGILTWSEWKLKSGWYGTEPDLRKKDTRPCYEPCYKPYYEILFCFYKFVSMWPYLYYVSFYVNANKKLRPQYLCYYLCLTRIG